MTIKGINDDSFRKVLAGNLTPSESIETPERLFGRAKNLQDIDRAFNSRGRQIFIHGDRGVGKTSLALTAAHVHAGSSAHPITVFCSRTTGFSDVVHAIGNATIDIKKRMEKVGTRGAINLSLPVVGGGGYTPGTPSSTQIPSPRTVNDALDVVRYVGDKIGPTVVVVDEMERLQNTADRDHFAEFIKNLPSVDPVVKFIFCGIASTLDDLLGAHPSVGRILETIRLEKLHHDSLWQIINTAAEKLSLSVPRDILIRIGQISDGFPHYVHLIGESLFWSVFDDPEVVSGVKQRHFMDGVRSAIQRAEAVLRTQYDRATQKTKNTEDYEEALWALADRDSDRRQVTEIFETSYHWMMMKRPKRVALEKEKLNQRLLALRKESHGRIVVGYGSGWFSFRENIMRGYVRLKAEAAGLQIGQPSSRFFNRT